MLNNSTKAVHTILLYMLLFEVNIVNIKTVTLLLEN